MIALFVQMESDTRAKVQNTVFNSETLSPEKLAQAILVETKLEPTYLPKKSAIHYINPQTLEQWYEYVDRAATQEELMQDFVVEMEKVKQLSLHNYPVWRAGYAYVVNELCLYNNILYEVIQAHTSQADWTPNIVPALFKVKNPDNVILAWAQPLGAHDAYQVNDKVLHNNNMWICILPNNVWEPGVTGWTIVW